MAETRSLTFDLSPPILYELGFGAALEWLAEKMQQQYGLTVSVTGQTRKVPLSIEWQVTLFTAIRELLVNVSKHARTKSASVTLRRTKTEVILTVEDKGVGMDPMKRLFGKAASEGFGLFGIRERLGFMGGRVELASKPGKGTSVTLFVPLKSNGSGKRGDM